jgi:hypothetical protein
MSPCRPLQVVCAAPDGYSLTALKHAAVGAEWELAPGATSAEEALDQLEGHHALVLVVQEPVPGLVPEARRRFRALRIVRVGHAGGGDADVDVDSLEGVRAAILGAPPAAGPAPVDQGRGRGSE